MNFSLCENMLRLAQTITYAEIHEEFNKTNRVWIAHTEQEICAMCHNMNKCILYR